MGLIDRVKAAYRAWKLADSYSEDNPLFEKPPKIKGIVVTPKTAIQVMAVLACGRVLAESIASLSLITYKRRKDRGKDRAPEHPVYRLLHLKPNSFMTSYQFREAMMWQALLWKGAYAVIRWNDSGQVSEIVPLKAGATVPAWDDKGQLWYLTIIDGKQYALHYEEVLYIPGISLDGIVSQAIIDLAKNALTLSMAAEDHGIEFFGNGAKPAGVLTTDQKLTDEAYNRLKASWNDKSLNKVGGTKILEQGLKYQSIVMQNDQAQFLETRKFERAEIAGAFRVPPHMIADLEKATFSNIEHQSIEFVVHCLRPWLVKWEQEINTKLFTPTEQKRYFAEFLVDSLLRGDIKSRYDAYKTGRLGGWLSANDIREMENMNPIEGGDIYLVPLNMTTAEKIKNMPEGGDDIDAGKPKGAPSDPDANA